MPSFQELIQQDPEALRLQQALEAYTARGKASARVKTAAHALDEARALEQQARTLRDELLADLAHQLDALTEDDAVGRAHLAIDLAEINDDYRPAANALCEAEDDFADAEVALTAAVNEVARHPIVTPNP